MGAQHFANLFGETGEPIVLGIFVFLLGILSLKFTTTSTIYAYLLNQNYNVYFGCYNSCCINVLSILSTDQSTIRLRGFDFHPNLLFSIRFGVPSRENRRVGTSKVINHIDWWSNMYLYFSIYMSSLGWGNTS